MLKSALLTFGFYLVLIMFVSFLGPLGAGELAVTGMLALLFFVGRGTPARQSASSGS